MGFLDGTTITGDITTFADFRFRWKTEKEILLLEGKIVINSTGEVIGDIVCKSIDIRGIFFRKVTSRRMQM